VVNQWSESPVRPAENFTTFRSPRRHQANQFLIVQALQHGFVDIRWRAVSALWARCDTHLIVGVNVLTCSQTLIAF